MDHLNRREFLSSATALGLTAAIGGVGAVGARQAQAAGRGASTTWEIEAVRVEKTFFDGSVVPLFRYQSLPGTQSVGNVPLLEADELSPVTLRVTNNLDFVIRPIILGRKTAPEIQPGQTRNLNFTMPRSGLFLLSDANLGVAAGPVGFAAMIVSRRVPHRSLYAGRTVDREYFLLYENADDRWNQAVDAGQTPDTSTYEPNFHMVNGLSFPDTTLDKSTQIICQKGENVLLRCANMGHVRHAIHFHGYHAEVLARNNRRERVLGPKDTIPLPAFSNVDILLPVTQTGAFPVHPHSLTTVTDNGLYAHGQILQIVAS